MDEESKKKEEQQLFDQKMDTSITDGGNSIPVAPSHFITVKRHGSRPYPCPALYSSSSQFIGRFLCSQRFRR
ncbi:hypothetical protein PRIPAC_97639 [Pristionchus pacificus]|uniref:Uncharacterized protein n=1 Tax=Pristionchus pacificus TaxID=54126 RepID=A0A2A6B3I5_PRIPA|nr:hypothetical protein PRIPAC_97639 [Pristionchus pacificus]|eukprot:PDM60421.1 hypothetical protein PRIPAC_54246 [Pristionchus pacificus]